MDANTIPLYDRVKNQIYDEFQRLKRQGSLVLNSRKGEKKYALINFRAKYYNFYMEIFIQNSYDNKIEDKAKDTLEDYFNNMNKIKDDNDILVITSICAGVLRALGISDITFQKDERAI